MEEKEAAVSEGKIIVLLYHRVDKKDTDPWDICVTPERFEEQIQFLKNNFSVISISDAVEQVKNQNIPESSICITFDDGYADNFLCAKPILEAYQCPATFFIATAFIGKSKRFWWDELEIIFLHTKQLPAQLSLLIKGKYHSYTIVADELTDEQYHQHTQWKWHEEPPTNRCALFLNIWETLRPLAEEEIRKQINHIKKWCRNNNTTSISRLPMDKNQLTALSENPLFNIAMHTHTHPDLSATEKNNQVKEIMKCREVLNQKYGINNSYLAYPYGRYNEATLEAANETGIEGAFTTENVAINIDTNNVKLGRYQVCNWSTEELAKQLAAYI